MWYCTTFKVPPTDPSVQNLSQFDLQMWFVRWFAYTSPEDASLKLAEEAHGNIQFVTGDEKIDELERLLATGKKIPDLINHMVDPAYQDQVRDFLEHKKGRKPSSFMSVEDQKRAAQEIFDDLADEQETQLQDATGSNPLHGSAPSNINRPSNTFSEGVGGSPIPSGGAQEVKPVALKSKNGEAIPPQLAAFLKAHPPPQRKK